MFIYDSSFFDMEFSDKNYRENSKDSTQETLAAAAGGRRNKDRYSVVKNM